MSFQIWLQKAAFHKGVNNPQFTVAHSSSDKDPERNAFFNDNKTSYVKPQWWIKNLNRQQLITMKYENNLGV